jgi:hypothetical protein
MDLSGGHTESGSLFGMYPCVGGTANQRFTLNDKGELHVQAANSQCLQSEDGRIPNYRVVSLRPCDGQADQRWTLDDKGRISGIGGTCMNPAGGGAIQMRPCDQSDLENWNLVGTLRSTFDDKCLTLPSMTAGTQLTLDSCQAGNLQIFERSSTSQLKAAAPTPDGNCVQGGPPGAPITLAPCAKPGTDAAADQTWGTFSDGVWHLSNRNVCLGTDDDGTHAVARECGTAHVVGWDLGGY